MGGKEASDIEAKCSGIGLKKGGVYTLEFEYTSPKEAEVPVLIRGSNKVHFEDTIKTSSEKIKYTQEVTIEENDENAKKDMSKELENLNKIEKTKEPQPVITIKEHDIELLKNELDITYEQAKNKLIKSNGDVNKAFEVFINDFNLE